MIGKLQRVPLREVWRHEALDFTRWLEDNIDVLNGVVGLKLSNPERERAAGSFSVDLVAEDEAGNTVIIENQLEKSDHDHLGKLVTYLTAVGAKTAIWIVSHPRPEHISALAWLNESSAADFYLLKVEAVRIGDSPPAPLLTKIVEPSAEARSAGSAKKEMAERHTWRHDFWSSLLERAKPQTKLHANISPSQDSWISASAGVSGLAYSYTALKHHAGVELYIGRESEAENLAIFEDLLAHQSEVETAFGGALDWQRLDGRKACRIYHRVDLGGYRDQERWPVIQDGLIQAMIRLEGALRPWLPPATEAAKRIVLEKRVAK